MALLNLEIAIIRRLHNSIVMKDKLAEHTVCVSECVGKPAFNVSVAQSVTEGG